MVNTSPRIELLGRNSRHKTSVLGTRNYPRNYTVANFCF
jgi:hypothetical protein